MATLGSTLNTFLATFGYKLSYFGVAFGRKLGNFLFQHWVTPKETGKSIKSILCHILDDDIIMASELRERIASDLVRVGQDLESMLVERPRRRIVRTGIAVQAGEGVGA